MVYKVIANGTRYNQMLLIGSRDLRQPRSFQQLTSHQPGMSLARNYVVLEVDSATNFEKNDHSTVRMFINNLSSSIKKRHCRFLSSAFQTFFLLNKKEILNSNLITQLGNHYSTNDGMVILIQVFDFS